MKKLLLRGKLNEEYWLPGISIGVSVVRQPVHMMCKAYMGTIKCRSTQVDRI